MPICFVTYAYAPLAPARLGLVHRTCSSTSDTGSRQAHVNEANAHPRVDHCGVSGPELQRPLHCVLSDMFVVSLALPPQRGHCWWSDQHVRVRLGTSSGPPGVACVPAVALLRGGCHRGGCCSQDTFGSAARVGCHG
jgi:hypothetical protein